MRRRNPPRGLGVDTEAGQEEPDAPSSSSSPTAPASANNILSLLRNRETALRSPTRTNFSHFVLPTTGKLIEEFEARAYIGQFTNDGSLFYTATQNWRINVYDGHTFEEKLRLRAVPGQWTLTDAHLDPTGAFLAYSSITPVVYITRLDHESVQTPLNFDVDHMGRFGLWSLRWSADGSQIVAGSSDQSILVMDAVKGQLSQRILAHDDDVNAVCFADESTNVLISGSDDGMIKVWDRRALTSRPQGIFVGHTEGITYVAPKDGRYCVSNGKDQKAKLWDLRRMAPAEGLRSYQAATNRLMQSFDYRFQAYPVKPGSIKHPHDCSVATFIGHSVLKTLIRIHFSPQHSTGQRYVYTGSDDGIVHVYDTLSPETTVRVLDCSEVVKRSSISQQELEQDAMSMFLMRYLGRANNSLDSKGLTVRDVSWHPHSPTLASTAWTREGGALVVHDRW